MLDYHVVRCSRSAPVPRLPTADEARQDHPATRRASGNPRVLLLALQAGRDQGKGTDQRLIGAPSALGGGYRDSGGYCAPTSDRAPAGAEARAVPVLLHRNARTLSAVGFHAAHFRWIHCPVNRRWIGSPARQNCTPKHSFLLAGTLCSGGRCYLRWHSALPVRFVCFRPSSAATTGFEAACGDTRSAAFAPVVGHFLNLPILVRDANVAALYRPAVHCVADERLRWHVATNGLFPASQRHLVQLSRVRIEEDQLEYLILNHFGQVPPNHRCSCNSCRPTVPTIWRMISWGPAAPLPPRAIPALTNSGAGSCRRRSCPA